MSKPMVSEEEAHRFLAAHHRGPVDSLERLSGGFWASAFGYSFGGAELVARFGRDRSWFEVDAAAHAFRSPELPVPRVVALGDAFDSLSFAISERAEGMFLEDASDTPSLTKLVRSLLRGLRAAPEVDTDYTWRDWLLGGLDPAGRNGPLLERIASDERVAPVAKRAEAAFRTLLDACPERRDLVHGDLVHKNVLVAPDLSQVKAVFSWKCSARGDALFDAAWLAFWSPWFPGIGALDVWALADDGSPDASTRFACYQLQIGLTHLCWYTQIDDAENLVRCAARLDGLLEASS
jgi:hygromycin-B 4-O-kinase